MLERVFLCVCVCPLHACIHNRLSIYDEREIHVRVPTRPTVADTKAGTRHDTRPAFTCMYVCKEAAGGHVCPHKCTPKLRASLHACAVTTYAVAVGAQK